MLFICNGGASISNQRITTSASSSAHALMVGQILWHVAYFHLARGLLLSRSSWSLDSALLVGCFPLEGAHEAASSDLLGRLFKIFILDLGSLLEGICNASKTSLERLHQCSVHHEGWDGHGNWWEEDLLVGTNALCSCRALRADSGRIRFVEGICCLTGNCQYCIGVGSWSAVWILIMSQRSHFFKILFGFIIREKIEWVPTSI